MHPDIAELKIIVGAHDKEIRELKESHKELKEVLFTIKETFVKIKYWLMGGVSFFVLQQTGGVELLKAFIALL